MLKFSPAVMRHERSMAQCLPYLSQLSESVVRTTSGAYVQTFRLSGAAFESADDAQLNNWHERLNILWRNVASPNVALWTHVVRRRAPTRHSPEARADGFADALHRKYRERLRHETLMANELYLSTVYRPMVGAAAGLTSRLLRRAPGQASERAALEMHADALEACEKLAQTVLASLARYEPERLGCYVHNTVLYSQPLEFLASLINAEVRPVPLPRGPVNRALASSRLLFGTETLEYRTASRTVIAAILGVKEYPTPNIVGMYDRLLSAPFSFVATQSFTFLTKGASQGLLQRQINRMENAGDFAISQAAQLSEALDALTSNEFVFGDHHFSLQVLSEIDPGREGSTHFSGLKELNEHIAMARSLLADTGMTVAREDMAMEAAFWAQLPGNFPLRPRKSPITSRNFAAMSAFHNYPGGRATGNHWGDAVTTLMTNARSAYHFSLHASDPRDPDGGSRKDTGHTFICGPTGCGKTVLVGFLVAMLDRHGVTQILFDKDCGLEILVRAMGGEYFPLKNGVATGFNPLQLPTTPDNVEFLKRWLQSLVCGSSHGGLSVRQQDDLNQALNGTLSLDSSARRLSRLIEFLDPTDPEGVHARLTGWCESGQGDYAWAFDNDQDSIAEHLTVHRLIGFDVTEFLDHDMVRTPITLYLFHLVRQMLDGRRLVCWMDEFWRLLADSAFAGFAKDGPKTWRKLNAVMCLATQSVSDVLESPISRTIIEQTPTKILFPNPDANLEDYIDGLGLTEREFALIKERLEPGCRSFLIKQGHHSVVCQLDLKGFDDELRVISGRSGEIERMRQLVASCGAQASNWLPAFFESRSQS